MTDSFCNVDINSDLLIEIRSDAASEPDENSLLLGHGRAAQLDHSFCLMFWHWAGLFFGALAFVIGNFMYSNPEWEYGERWCAGIYTSGSLSFLFSDIFQFLGSVHTDIPRTNLWWSVVGSLMYVIGSIGFFPEVYFQTNMLGIWGFILGSFIIGCSQYWKVYRLGMGSKGRFHISNLLAKVPAFVEFGVELSAGLGAWCYLIGMGMYLDSTLQGSFEGPWYLAILYIWSAGSFFFLLRSLFLGYRYWTVAA